jgi:hypothetical protein
MEKYVFILFLEPKSTAFEHPFLFSIKYIFSMFLLKELDFFLLII